MNLGIVGEHWNKQDRTPAYTYPFNKYFLMIYYMTGTIPNVIKEKNMFFTFKESSILTGKIDM